MLVYPVCCFYKRRVGLANVRSVAGLMFVPVLVGAVASVAVVRHFTGISCAWLNRNLVLVPGIL